MSASRVAARSLFLINPTAVKHGRINMLLIYCGAEQWMSVAYQYDLYVLVRKYIGSRPSQTSQGHSAVGCPSMP